MVLTPIVPAQGGSLQSGASALGSLPVMGPSQLMFVADKYPPRPGGGGGTGIRIDQGRINSTTGRRATSGSSSFSVDRSRVSPPASATSGSTHKKAKKKKTARTKCNWRLKDKDQTTDCLRKKRQKSLVKTKPSGADHNRTRVVTRTPDAALSIVVPPVPLPRFQIQASDSDQRADEVLVTTFGDSADVSAIAVSNGLRVIAQRYSQLLQVNIVQFAIDDGRPVADVIAQLKTTAKIETTVPNHVYALQESDFENARFAPRQIGLNTIGGKLTGNGVRVAVIDTAVDETHPALKRAIAAKFDGLPDMPVSQRQHGTAIAGLIAGRTVLRGAAPASELLIARAFDGPDPSALTTDTYILIACLDWAVQQQANIINMSFAGPDNRLLADAVAKSADRNVIIVAAAGNNGPKAAPAYPGAYAESLAVTATDAKNKIYEGANHGDYVFIAAPGVDILAPIPGGRVDIVSGTSFSAALVSGIAALHIERMPGASRQEVFDRLSQSGRDLGREGRDRVFGHGLIDAARLVSR